MPKLDGDEELDSDHASLPSMAQHKVVVKLQSGDIVKGHCILPRDADLGNIFNEFNENAEITVSSVPSNEPRQVALRDIKAVFFVKLFRGDPKRRGVRFYAKWTIRRANLG
jgi:hypothetical protein